MNYDELEAGYELDALVAEKVMGLVKGSFGWINSDTAIPIALPLYSTDIAAAWEVVERFKDWDWKLYSHGEGESFVIYKDGTHYEATAPTAPLAICRAALKAVTGSKA